MHWKNSLTCNVVDYIVFFIYYTTMFRLFSSDVLLTIPRINMLIIYVHKNHAI